MAIGQFTPCTDPWGNYKKTCTTQDPIERSAEVDAMPLPGFCDSAPLSKLRCGETMGKLGNHGCQLNGRGMCKPIYLPMDSLRTCRNFEKTGMLDKFPMRQF